MLSLFILSNKMAEATVDVPQTSQSFYCHQCDANINHVLPDFLCPQCKSGFVEELENNVSGRVSSDESNDVPPMRAGFLFEPLTALQALQEVLDPGTMSGGGGGGSGVGQGRRDGTRRARQRGQGRSSPPTQTNPPQVNSYPHTPVGVEMLLLDDEDNLPVPPPITPIQPQNPSSSRPLPVTPRVTRVVHTDVGQGGLTLYERSNGPGGRQQITFHRTIRPRGQTVGVVPNGGGGVEVGAMFQDFINILIGGGMHDNNHMPIFVNMQNAGNLGDYAWGRRGLDDIITQLLNQIEGTGPPPLPQEQISVIPTVSITQQQVENHLQCSVCMEDFKVSESVRRLTCEHHFHDNCIVPWLQLHGTCPICRKSLDENGTRSSSTGGGQPPPSGPVTRSQAAQQQQQQGASRGRGEVPSGSSHHSGRSGQPGPSGSTSSGGHTGVIRPGPFYLIYSRSNTPNRRTGGTAEERNRDRSRSPPPSVARQILKY
ncbi:unnamed protein product [Darwinula stevensoni]|uniref:RING-type E3 ubiquitin transferase n=1 Tax=Darwinula stevensoni TaxID=69355 RepID=A0A7R9FNV6_9CRUS|nr:unnamed protein product [Darwinula stevensoni]CAG0896839.1 unnamed protein product [Darwinula stevensoni]